MMEYELKQHRWVFFDRKIRNFLITVKKNYYLIFLIFFIKGKIYSYIGNRGEW